MSSSPTAESGTVPCLSTAEIAAELFIGENTVRTHVGRVFTKLGARDRAQAVVLAFRAGLVE